MTEWQVDHAKPLDVVTAGSWSNFDHLFRVEKLPEPGDTVRIISPIELIEKTYFGGCAPNTVAAAAKLGAKTGLVSVVGHDFDERGLRDHYASLGVDLRGLVVVEGMRCGHSFIFTDGAGVSMTLSHLGVAEGQESLEPDRSLLSTTKVLVVNYRFDRFAVACAQIGAEAGALVIVSGSLATAPNNAAGILGAADIVVCNGHELDLLLAELGLPSKSSLFTGRLKAIVETHGVRGSEVITPEGQVHIPAIEPDRVVDTSGAGDGFVGGLAAGLALGNHLHEAVRLGAVVASFVVEDFGCQTNLPTYRQASGRLRLGRESPTP